MFSERITDALVFRNERQREIESLPKSIYIAFPFPSFSTNLRFNYAVNLVTIVSSPKTKKIERSIFLFLFLLSLLVYCLTTQLTYLSQHRLESKDKEGRVLPNK